MASTDHTIGMMDGAYFTGRKEILEWINDTLGIGVTKIEQTCTGAIACQLLDAHFPGNVQMNKLNWEAKSDHEYTANYKIMQAAFTKLNIAKTTEPERLARGKYQDNLEFMQWFKGFCSKHSVDESYDPAKARAKGKGARKVPDLFGQPGATVTTVKARRHASSGALGDTQREKKAEKKAAAAARASADSTIPEDKENHGAAASTSLSAPAAAPVPLAPSNAQSTRPAATPGHRATKPLTTPMPPAAAVAVSSSAAEPAGSAGSGSAAVVEALKVKCGEAELRAAGLTLHIEGVEKERDFYFGKLQDIEALLQGKEDSGDFADGAAPHSALAQELYGILYATTGDFVAVAANGEVEAPVESAN